ncbi:hypothetical protein J437_LFUL009167 [Ladona fulva]|uniref:LIM zinc-binding domain-containing protein n=1 Tax=Ladona fulva TaxID=123851 RepID=A0A8K0K7L2_LADFU|nr:hypothetical protein J437_LFUL009167 [Ladona fulva]
MYPSHILQIAWRIPRPLHVSPLISNDRKFQWLLRDSYAPKTTVIDTAIIQAKEGEGCPRCGGVVYAAEQVLSKSRAPAGQGCPRCGGMVYAAEQQLAKGTMWHKKCFNCAECHRPLDSMLACDGPDKEVHCKSCYGKRFGPKGFGFGYAPTLVSTDGEAPVIHDGKPMGAQATDGKGCPRCGQNVYAAEQMISKKHVWHRRCFNCGDCHKSLDSTTLNDGPDGDIYCKSCYGRKFGIKGVGYGMGAGCLTML